MQSNAAELANSPALYFVTSVSLTAKEEATPSVINKCFIVTFGYCKRECSDNREVECEAFLIINPVLIISLDRDVL